MKLLFLILLMPLVCVSQKKFISGNDILIYSAQFIAGGADGLHEVLVNHIHTFEKVCPNANMSWWNPQLSQHNKEHTLTIISDGYHLTRTIEHSMNYFSIGVSLCDLKGYSKKQIPLMVAKKMLLSMISNRLAFHIVYDGFFNNRK